MASSQAPLGGGNYQLHNCGLCNLKFSGLKKLNIFLLPFLEKPPMESAATQANSSEKSASSLLRPGRASLYAGWSRAWSQAVAQLHLARCIFAVALEAMGTICYPATQTPSVATAGSLRSVCFCSASQRQRPGHSPFWCQYCHSRGWGARLRVL